MKQGWEIKPLSDVCNLFTDGNWIESKDQSIEGIRLLQTGNIRQGEYFDKSDKAKFISEETFKRLKCTEVLVGDILVSRLPEPVGRSCIIPDINSKMITAVDCTIIRTNEHLLPELLRYYQLSKRYLNDVDSKTTGTTRNRISRKNLGTIEIPIPPLNEQKRIVAKLDECFEAIDKARANVEKNLNNAKELFQSKLNEIFSQKGDGWVEKKLSDIGKSSMCKRIFKNETSSEGEIPFYKIGTFGKNPDAYITKTLYDEYRSKYRFPKKGDILISASGTIGRTVVYDGEPAYYQDSNIVWIDNDETQVLNRFLYHSYKVVKWGEEEGATIKRLYNSNLEKIKIRYPQSTDHQKEIINDIDNLISKTQSLESNYQQELDALDELKKSILQKAFNGEL